MRDSVLAKTKSMNFQTKLTAKVLLVIDQMKVEVLVVALLGMYRVAAKAATILIDINKLFNRIPP